MHKAVLFDLDGVVADTEPLKAYAHAQTALCLGGHLSKDLYPRLLGHSQEEVAKAVLRQTNITIQVSTYNELFARNYKSILTAGVTAMPGIADVLHVLIDHSFALGVVTSSSNIMMRAVLDSLKITNLFDITVSSDD